MLSKTPIVSKGDSLFTNNEYIYLNRAVEFKKESCTYHSHDFIEIAYVSSGRGTHIIGDRSIPVSKGHIFIINYNTPHVFIQDDDGADGDFVVLNCVFKPEFIDYSLINCNDFSDITASLLFSAFFIEENPAFSLKLMPPQMEDIEGLYNKMLMEYSLKQKGYINILRSCLIEMLTKLFRIADSDRKLYEDPSNLHKLNIISTALKFLKENYSKSDLNINEVAVKTFLSRAYLSKLFKDVTGQNYTGYLHNLRISEACRLLKSSDKKVTDIMFDVGYRDIKNFNRVFKKIVGMTPSEYKKSN